MKKSYIMRLAIALSVMLSAAFSVAFAEEPIALDSIDPPNFYVTYDNHVNLFMTVSSRFEIDSVYVDKNKAILKDDIFTVLNLPLISGRNAFIVRIKDTLGNTGNYLYTVYRQEPMKEPEVSIETPEEPVSSEEVKTQAATNETVKAEPVTTAKEIPVNNQSYSPAGGFLTKPSPITAYKNVIMTDTVSDTIASSPVSSSSASTSGSKSYVSEESVSSNGTSTIVFSSPYDKQVVTENSLRISGGYDPSAGISSITVNGQACILDFANNTFTGPMLISPGEARRRGIKSEGGGYIIMDVDSNTHSGKNVLRVLITNDLGRTDKQDLILYYYQLFVRANTYGECILEHEDGTRFSTPVQNTQSYNKNLYYEQPYSGWAYPEKAYRDESHLSWPYTFTYSDDMRAFYYTDNSPRIWSSLVSGSSYLSGHSYVDTSLLLHAPPESDAPFILVLKDVATIEGLPIFSGWVYNAIENYKFNGYPIFPLMLGSRNNYYDSCYVIIDEFTPDKDFYVSVQTPNYGEGFISYGAYTNKHFHVGNITSLSADILVDSNNDGFLGGEDNTVEQNEPGCVFWVNDDDDYDESSVHPDDEGAANSPGSDSSDDFINGIRDLEDLMPFNITIPDIAGWASNQSVKFYLKAEGEGKVRVFKRIQDAEKENDLAYLKKLNRSKEQYTEKMKFLLPSEADTENKGQLLDASWFDSEGRFYAIFEGVEKGSLKLTLEVELISGKKSRRVVLDEAYITMVNVKEMLKVYNSRYTYVVGDEEGPTDQGDGLLRYKVIREQKGYGSRFPEDPDRIIIWTHGYNNTIKQSLDNMVIIFKRLYRTGYRGGFIGVVWKVEHSALLFNTDWLSSYQTGHVFADIIRNTKNSYPDAKLDLFMHSLGANLGCYALRILSDNDERIVDNLILHEAAVPGEVFSGTYCEIKHYGNNLRDGYFDNIYANSLNVLKGKVYNTYSANDFAIYGAFPLAGAAGLSTPLDDDYVFVNEATRTQISLDPDYNKGLGCSPINTVFDDKIISVDSLISCNLHPYGIRDHGSQCSEYYYDVLLFFNRVFNLKTMEKPDLNDDEEE